MSTPRAMNHAGLTVTDIDAAVEWYCDVLGCTVVMAPMEAHEDGIARCQLKHEKGD